MSPATSSNSADSISEQTKRLRGAIGIVHPSLAMGAQMMPLTPTSGTVLADTWGVYFNMLGPNGTSVLCTVTRGMLDELAQGKGETSATEQLAILRRLANQHRIYRQQEI